MTLPPLTLFALAFVIGALGGLWHVVSQDEQQRWKDYVDGTLGGSLIGLSVSLLLYEKFGTTEFGACTLLGLSLILSMGGKAAFHLLLDGAARIYLGSKDRRSQQGPWQEIPQRRRPDWGQKQERDDEQDTGSEMSTWP